MSSSSEPIAPRIHAPFTPPPAYTSAIRAQRIALEAEIERDRITLEKLRVKETGLRAELVLELKHLHFNIEVAAHRIETRQWADGCAALDRDFEHVLEAQEALMDCVDDIAHTASMIAEQQGELEDAALWKEENDNV